MRRTAWQDPVETTPDNVTCSPEEVLHWAWTKACALLYCGEDPNDVSQDELQRRFYRDLRKNRPNLMVYVDPRCRVVKMDTLGQFTKPDGKTEIELKYEATGEADKIGQFARLGDGSLLTVGDNETFISRDDGATWSAPRRMCPGTAKSRPTAGGILSRTRRGHLVYAYLDTSTFRWSWDEARREAADDARLDVWVIRSEDDGRTWQDKQRVFAGYCGALRDMIETADGNLVLPVTRLLRNPSRHGIGVYVSSDDGNNWVPSADIIDLGGHGHHDGACEPTIVQLRDGRLWMLIRTTLGQFWSAFSSDGGRAWPILRPSAIEASSAPAAMIRLVSGRLVLAWNRLCSTQRKHYPRFGGDGQIALRPFSGHRQELSISFSEDDGATWSAPQVIIRKQDYGIAYPYLFELEPGRIWLSTQYCYKMALTFSELDFVGHTARQRETSK
ncbi:MAG: sialidase family protein [Armatimonadota bacterium]